MKATIKYYWSTLQHKAWVFWYLLCFSVRLFFMVACGYKRNVLGYSLFKFAQSCINNTADFMLLPDMDANMQLISIFQKTPRYGLFRFCFCLFLRGALHDWTKLLWSEAKGFISHIDRLAEVEYGSPAYQAMLIDLKPTIMLHYKRNRHHPEHYQKEKILGMNLLDIIEMFYDWKASGRRSLNGNLNKSISIQAGKLNLEPATTLVLINTI